MLISPSNCIGQICFFFFPLAFLDNCQDQMKMIIEREKTLFLTLKPNVSRFPFTFRPSCENLSLRKGHHVLYIYIYIYIYICIIWLNSLAYLRFLRANLIAPKLLKDRLAFPNTLGLFPIPIGNRSVLYTSAQTTKTVVINLQVRKKTNLTRSVGKSLARVC